MYIRGKVSIYNMSQTPQYGKIRDVQLDEGDFVLANRFVNGNTSNITNNVSSVNNPIQNMGNLTPVELSRWQGIRECTDLTKVKQFIKDFPNGTFTPVAQNCLTQLQAELQRQQQQITQNQPLYIDTTPSNAKVRILNINPVYHYGMKLKAGTYHVEVSKTGFITQKNG